MTASEYAFFQDNPFFMGHRRAGDRAGTRNYIGVFVVGNCASTAARQVAAWFAPQRLAAFPNVDGVLPFVHELGCGMEKSGEPMDLLRRALGGTIRNPNLAGAVVMALGCERNNIYAFLEQEGLGAGDRLKTVVLQEVGGTARGIEDGIAAVNSMLPLANQSAREPVPASQLVLGLQASNMAATSLAQQAALGWAVDRLIEAGGTVLVSETRATAPALAPRAATAQVGQQLEQRITWWKQHIAGRDTGLAARLPAGLPHAGSSPLAAVIGYAHRVSAQGLVLMDAPSYEAISATGQVASGANLVCLITHGGSTFGAAGAPTLKVATDSTAFADLPDDLDFDAGDAAPDAADAQALGQRLFAQWLAHASGRRTCSEKLGVGDDEFVPWSVGVMA